MFKSQLLQTVAGGLRDVVDPVSHFSSDEEIASWDPILLDGNADLLFVTIHLRAVDMSVALLDGCFDHLHKSRVQVSESRFLEPSSTGSKSELTSQSAIFWHTCTSDNTLGIELPSLSCKIGIAITPWLVNEAHESESP
jgi:hypothetical protein